jgi:cytochrome o ubiquinol oxidase subunit 1
MPSPPPAWNFTRLPSVQRTDAYWYMKEETTLRGAPAGSFADLHLPRNSPVGVFLAFCAVILGFALIWRIFWLAGLGLVAAVAVVLREAWKTDLEVRVPADEVAAFERAHPAPIQQASTGDRDVNPPTSGHQS